MIDLKEIYEIRKTDEYQNASSLWDIIDDNNKWKLEAVIGSHLYSILVFVNKLMIPLIENNCDLAFDCSEHGFSYEIGCYFQNKKYLNLDNINSDIKKFSDLKNIYDKDSFPEEVKLLDKITDNLTKFISRCKTYELK